jgi:enoyl-[acyl-carrier protein] reductase II
LDLAIQFLCFQVFRIDSFPVPEPRPGPGCFANPVSLFFYAQSNFMSVFSNRITILFGIDYPIIQAGMIWASGWRLASAVSNAGALGLIGSGSMHPDTLREHIRKTKRATQKPFGVNVPLMYPDIDKHMNIVLEEKVPIVFTSAGNPTTWTGVLKESGVTVVHVVSSSKFAQKAQDAGCDAVVAEGFEAGGHNGREETTTLVLLPAVCNTVKIPVISAGGLATGRQMLAVMILGAEGVQMGSRFVLSEEASSHPRFKQLVLDAKEGDTMLSIKQLTPVRMLRNKFFQQIQEAEQKGMSPVELKKLLGQGRAKKGMFEGELDEGELEIGQVSALLKDILPAEKIVKNIWSEFSEALSKPLPYV